MVETTLPTLLDERTPSIARRSRLMISFLVGVASVGCIVITYGIVTVGKVPRRTIVVAKNSTTTAKQTTLTFEDVNCSLEERTRSTFLCPYYMAKRNRHSGSLDELSTLYSNNMLAMYQGTDRDLFLKCAGQQIPLQDVSPQECWPRPIILASWPTSGSTLTRVLLQTTTSPMEVAMHEYQEGERLFFRHVVPPNDANGNLTIDIFGNVLKRPAALPLIKRALIFKSHTGTETDEKIRRYKRTLLTQAKEMGRLDGIIRLARNPGDHILRNTFRWSDPKCYRAGEECFFLTGNLFCERMEEEAHKYIKFHEFWNTMDKAIPQIIVHYEHVSTRAKAPGTIKGILSFLDDLTPEMDYRRLIREEEMLNMQTNIRDPKYVQGSTMAEVCGKEVSRKIHAITKHTSGPLGYKFDQENATWQLHSDMPHKLTN